MKSFKYNKLSDKFYAKRNFKKKTGKDLCLSNPVGFHEKLQWLKLYDRPKLQVLCADKFAVRNIVEKQIGHQYLIPLKYKTYDWKAIKKENVPNNSVIKCNHDSGNVHIVRDSENFDFSFAQKKLRKSLRSNYYHSYREWQYKNIEPLILVENLILDADGKIPKDYKFFCFDGICHYVEVDNDRFSKPTRDIYDKNWNRLNIKYKFPNSKNGSPEPKNLDLMINLAEKLSSPFSFCRVDFYDTGEKVYFGEMTFHPGAGFGTLEPENWQKIWGDKITLRKTTSF